MAEHNTLTGSALHEPKGAASAVAGQVYIADGSGSGAWTALPSTGTVTGWFDYNDLATTAVPLTASSGTWLYLTNDELGDNTNKSYSPAGVSDVWDASINKFDWSDLELGDTVDIRVDLDITTSSANQVVELHLELATDSVSFDIPFAERYIKGAGAQHINAYNGVYMGSTDVLNNRARLKIKSDSNLTVVVNGWYCKVNINR